MTTPAAPCVCAGTPPSQQLLVFAGQELLDGALLAEMRLEDYSLSEQVGRLGESCQAHAAG